MTRSTHSAKVLVQQLASRWTDLQASNSDEDGLGVYRVLDLDAGPDNLELLDALEQIAYDKRVDGFVGSEKGVSIQFVASRHADSKAPFTLQWASGEQEGPSGAAPALLGVVEPPEDDDVSDEKLGVKELRLKYGYDKDWTKAEILRDLKADS